MRHNTVINLLTKKIIIDKYLNEKETWVPRKVYANLYDVTSSEFYNASVAGMKPTNSWEIKTFEYKGEEYLEFEEKKYKIIRVSTRGDNTRLIGEVILGVN